MSRRRIERAPELARWQRHALLGLGRDGLTEHESMDWLIDGDIASLAQVWARHRERLLAEWRELRGNVKHPMDRQPASLPKPR